MNKKKKVVTIFERTIHDNKKPELRCIYAYDGYLYCMNPYMAIKVKGEPSEFHFDSEVKLNDDTLVRYFKNDDRCVSFDLPDIEELKATIRERMYSRSKKKLFKASYKIVDRAYVNAFFLLDAMTLMPNAYGIWSGEILVCRNSEGEPSASVAKGLIHITDNTNEMLICPIKVPKVW